MKQNIQIEKNFELRERILGLMDNNLEIRQKIYIPVKETFISKLFRWVKRLLVYFRFYFNK